MANDEHSVAMSNKKRPDPNLRALIEHFKELERLHSSLTTQEADVLSLISDGETCTTIAKRLDLGVRTVERIRSRIIDKFGVRSIPQIIVAAAEYRILKQLSNAFRDE